MKKWAAYVLCFLSFAVGVGATYVVLHYGPGSFIGKILSRKSYSFRGEAAVTSGEDLNAQSDIIPFPKIGAVSLKAEFVEPPNAASGSPVSLSYIAEIVVDKLEKKDLPAKFSKTFEEGSAKWQFIPPDDVMYEASLKIALLDKDGFPISSVTTAAAPLRSGEVNALQDVSGDKVPADVAQRTKSIKPAVVLVKYVRPVYRQKAGQG